MEILGPDPKPKPSKNPMETYQTKKKQKTIDLERNKSVDTEIKTDKNKLSKKV